MSKKLSRNFQITAIALVAGLVIISILIASRSHLPTEAGKQAGALSKMESARPGTTAVSGALEAEPAHRSRVMSDEAAAVAATPVQASVMSQNGSTSEPKHIIQRGPREKAAFTGEEAQASVRVGDTEYELTPNQLKMFPRIAGIQPGQKLPVSISYPKGVEGEPVVVEAQDGGLFENDKKVQIDRLDHAKNLAFAFTAGHQAGVYRVVLRKGADQKMLDFWVGPEAPLRE